MKIQSVSSFECAIHKNDCERIYSKPTKVPCHPLKFGTIAAIFINVVFRYSKMDMRYRMRPLTAPLGGKLWS